MKGAAPDWFREQIRRQVEDEPEPFDYNDVVRAMNAVAKQMGAELAKTMFRTRPLLEYLKKQK